MKIIWSGIGITNGRGKIGAEVATKNRAGAMMRQYVVPTDPRTSAQVAHRSEFANVISLWQSLDEQDRKEWERAAQFVTRKNTVGNAHKLTGAIYFQQCNMNMALTGFGNVLLPNPFAKPVPLSRIEVTHLTDSTMVADTFAVNGLTTIPANNYVVCFANKGSTPQTNVITNGYRFLLAVPDGSNYDGIDLYSQWFSLWGAPSPGTRIFFRAKSINVQSGINSAWVQCSAFVS